MRYKIFTKKIQCIRELDYSNKKILKKKELSSTNYTYLLSNHGEIKKKKLNK